MNINVRMVQKTAVVELDGTVDSRTVPLIQTRIAPLVRQGSRIVLDMTRVTYLSSAGLRLLVATYRHVSSEEGEFVLAGLGDRVRDTMSVTGFLPYFIIYETVEAAVADLE